MDRQVAGRISTIRARIERVCERFGRDIDSITLVAVSKTFPAGMIHEAVVAGQSVFGESRFQEAEPKILALPSGLEWHFIGRIQSNKVRKILSMFPIIHGVHSLKLATYIDAVAADLKVVPKIFMQVNIANEVSKTGFSPEELIAGMKDLHILQNLKVIGLMCIPPETATPEESRLWFRKLKELRNVAKTVHGIHLPFLSMGMSNDFEIAIEEGATHVRIGSAIFGGRSYLVDDSQNETT